VQAVFNSDQGQWEVLHPHEGQQEVQLTAAGRKNAALHDVSKVVFFRPYLVWKFRFGLYKLDNWDIVGTLDFRKLHKAHKFRGSGSGSGSYLVFFVVDQKIYCQVRYGTARKVPVVILRILLYQYENLSEIFLFLKLVPIVSIRIRNYGPQAMNYIDL
jgi:hypothetical protein